MRDYSRRREADAVVRHFTELAAERPDVRALALVGSYARGEPRMGSDVDLVLLTDERDLYVQGEWWLSIFGRRVRLLRTQQWGPTILRRVRTASGLHVELGVSPPSWASTEPLDPGARCVVASGMVILHDPDDLRGPRTLLPPGYSLPESTVADWMTGLRAGPKGGA